MPFRLATVSATLVIAFLISGCAMQYKEKSQAIERQQVNCATAEGDIRVLQSEKAHVAQQIVMGVTAITVPGFVLGVLSGTEETKLNVASGDYNQMIDRKIADIRATCRLQ